MGIKFILFVSIFTFFPYQILFSFPSDFQRIIQITPKGPLLTENRLEDEASEPPQHEFEHDLSHELIGTWKFIGYLYQGHFQEGPNPDLIMTFEFSEDRTNRLYWFRQNQSGFCERKGQFEFDGEWLKDEITWVNPKNAMDCGSDPDMQKGRTQIINVQRKENKIYFDLPLGDERIIYVWEWLVQ